MKPSRIEVTIDELVLHGFAPGDRYAIAAALEKELARLLSEQGVAPALMRAGDTERIDAGSISLATGPQANIVGVQGAKAVYGGLQS